MTTLFYIVAGLILIFGLVVFVGAPYLPTLKHNIVGALKLLDLKPGQTLLELGSGDGRVLKAAAEQGIRVVGYELNPLLVLWSKALTWRHRKLVVVKWGSYWQADWPETDAIYTFLLQKYMKRLDNKIIQTYSPHNHKCNKEFTKLASSTPVSRRKSGRCSKCGGALGKSIKLVSLAFTIPGRKPVKQSGALFLYKY